MTQTPEFKTLVIEHRLPHAQDKVWRGLTQSELMADWLMANDFEPVVGKRFTLRTTPNAHWNGIITGEVLEVEPISRLVYQLVRHDHRHDPGPRRWRHAAAAGTVRLRQRPGLCRRQVRLDQLPEPAGAGRGQGLRRRISYRLRASMKRGIVILARLIRYVHLPPSFV